MTRRVFRDALLHTTVITSGYLRYCHLPVSFDQPGPPLTSLINKAFLPPAELPLAGYFFGFSHHSLQSLVTVVPEIHKRCEQLCSF